MGTKQKVVDQLGKSIQAHRTAHHHSVRMGRRARAELQAERAALILPPEEVAEPEPSGMPAGLPVQDVSGMYDVGAGD